MFGVIDQEMLKMAANNTRMCIIELQANYSSIRCVYWNHEDGTWSTEGVDTDVSKNNHVTCLTHHLSSFTLLAMNPSFMESNNVAETVTYVSYIGCGVVMFCLLTTLIIYCFIQCTESDKYGKVWINVCLAILLLNVFYVVATRWNLCNTAGCTALTYLFHVFLFAAFLWFIIDIIDVYQLVVTDFITYEKHFLVIRVVCSWGLPLLAAAITLIIDAVRYESAAVYCRLPIQRAQVFYVTFLGYVCLAILIGLIMFVITLIAIFLRREKDPRIAIRQIASTPVIMSLTGAAWILGVLTARHGGLGLNVAFCIINSLSGLLLLVERCLFQNIGLLRAGCCSSSASSLDVGKHRRHSDDSLDSRGSHTGDAVIGRTISSSRNDTHDVFAGSAIITPPTNGSGWGRRKKRSPATQLKYGRPDVHCSDTIRNDNEALAGKSHSDVTQQIGPSVNGTYRTITTTSGNNETLTYI